MGFRYEEVRSRLATVVVHRRVREEARKEEDGVMAFGSDIGTVVYESRKEGVSSIIKKGSVFGED